MRLALLLFFLLPASVVSAQKPDSCDCKSINSYAENHLGPGQYAKDYSKTPYTGICGQLGYQGVPYLWHKYENGYLVKRIDYDYSSRTVTYFDDIRKDTLISVQKTFTMDTKILVDEDIIYESGGNRYERDTKFWTNGDSLEVTRYRYLKRGEPGATDDWRLAFNRDDYYWEPVKDGPYISFHEWGSAPTKFRHVVGNYTNGQRSGYWEVRFSNGNLKSQGNFVNDRENGHWKYFQYYGGIESEGEYDAYGKEGKWLHLDDKGRLLREENYSKGKLDGDFVLYYPETQVVKMTTHYAAGIQSGAHTSFYADAKKDTVSFYNAGGMRDGKMTVYLADGTVCYEATFVNGIPTGTSKRWYDNHQLMEVDNFDSNGQPDDTCLVYYENGQTKSVSVYSHGTREGKWTAWYANGKKQSEANYRKGRKTGTFSDWNSSGILVSQASYKNDTLNGSCKTFYGSGTAKTDYRYTMGIRDGKCTRYDTSGNVTFTRTYAKGKPLNYSPPRKIPGASRCTPDPASPFSLCDSLQEAFHNEAVFIAMRTMWTDSAWKDSVVVRESMIRSIERSLVAVWNFLPPGSFGFTWEYGLPRENGLHELSITYTDKDSFNQAVYNNWKNGKGETGISGIDRILKKYSLTLVPNTFYAYQNEFSVSYTTPLVLNFRGLTAELQKADGHFAAYTSWGTAGDGDHVYQQRKGNITLLTFSHGYGDCPSGCMGRENFVFIVYDDGEVETGDRIRAMSPYLRRN